MPPSIGTFTSINFSIDEGGELIVEASRDIQKRIIDFHSLSKDEIILYSYPIVVSPESSHTGKLCNYCYKSNEQLRRCSKCKLVCYCSKTCQKADW